MARTLSALAEAHRMRSDVAWARLAALTLWRDRYGPSPVSITLYFSDATRYVPVSGGGTREYLPLVLSWGRVGDALEATNPATARAGADLKLSDRVPIAVGSLTAERFTALIREGINTSGYDPGGGDLAIAWLPPGGVIGVDDVLLYEGRVDVVADQADEASVTLRSSSFEGSATIPVQDATLGPTCADGCPAWLAGKAFTREIHYDGDIVNGVPDFGDVDTGTSYEVDAAYVALLGANPPVLRETYELIWQDLRGSFNPNRWAGFYYILARDINGPFTHGLLRWFLRGSSCGMAKIQNFSTRVGSGTYATSPDSTTIYGVSPTLDILELEDIATQGEFDALKPSNPPAIKRVVASVAIPTISQHYSYPHSPTSDLTYCWLDAPEFQIPCARFLAFRFSLWLQAIPGDFFDGSANENLSSLGADLNVQVG